MVMRSVARAVATGSLSTRPVMSVPRAVATGLQVSLLDPRKMSVERAMRETCELRRWHLHTLNGLCPKSRISESAISGRLKIAQRFAGLAGVRDEVREADG